MTQSVVRNIAISTRGDQCRSPGNRWPSDRAQTLMLMISMLSWTNKGQVVSSTICNTCTLVYDWFWLFLLSCDIFCQKPRVDQRSWSHARYSSAQSMCAIEGWELLLRVVERDLKWDAIRHCTGTCIVVYTMQWKSNIKHWDISAIWYLKSGSPQSMAVSEVYHTTRPLYFSAKLPNSKHSLWQHLLECSGYTAGDAANWAF